MGKKTSEVILVSLFLLLCLIKATPFIYNYILSSCTLDKINTNKKHPHKHFQEKIFKGGDNVKYNYNYVLVPMTASGSYAVMHINYYRFLKDNHYDSFDLYL